MGNKIYFALSDVHGFASEMEEALEQAGFDLNDEDHVLIVLGDVFDRGEEALEVYRYLSSVPASRLILIKGNHESLYLDLLKKGHPEDYDFSNGTVGTFCQIANESIEPIENFAELASFLGEDGLSPSKKEVWARTKRKVRASEITAWLKSPQWRDYFELGPYLFVHSFIPLKIKKEYEAFYGKDYVSEVPSSCLEPFPSWRSKASKKDWVQASWGCPYERFASGLFDKELKKGKVLVCGHWHTSDFFYRLKGIRTFQTGIYYSRHLIALDGGVQYGAGGKLVHDQNVLVIKDGVCYDRKGNPLSEPSGLI